MRRIHGFLAAIAVFLVASPALAAVTLTDEESDFTVTLGGWARLDYQYGDRSGKDAGYDTLGISRASAQTTVSYDNWDLFMNIGATAVSSGGGFDSNGVVVADLFMNWNNVGGSNVLLRGGAQPMLFGLKPNGYDADRTVVGSIEYGAAGAFAVSNQANAALRFVAPFLDEMVQLEGGLFDSSINTSPVTGKVRGSTIWQNAWGQIRVNKLGIDGLYAVAGVQGVYVGTTGPAAAPVRINKVRPIYDAGLGFDNGMFNVSVEYIHLHEDIVGSDQLVGGTAGVQESGHESYLIAEAGAHFGDFELQADYSRGHRLKAHTGRFGLLYQLNPFVNMRVEYAHDFLANRNDVESINARLTLSF